MARTKSEVIEKPLSKRVLVNVRRDQTTATPRVVWAHEVPILQTIFGEGNVTEVEPSTLDEGYTGKPDASLMPFNKQQDKLLQPSRTSRIGWVFVGNPEAEYERLVAAYGRHVDVPRPNVEFVYDRFATGRFSMVVGGATLDDCPDDQLRDMILNWGYQLPLETFESTEQERNEARKAWAEFRALDHGALVKLAEEIGVQVG